VFLKKVPTSKGRIFLQIVEGYRNEEGKTTHRVVESLGYLDELDEKFDGKAIEYYTNYAKQLSGNDRLPKEITFKTNRIMESGKSSLKNVGYLALKPIYKDLKLNDVCHALNVKYKTTTDISDVLEFLLYSKIIDSSSKLSSFVGKDKYFENFTFSEEQMYRCLSYLGNSYEQIKDFVFHTTNEKYGLDMSKSYYDGTNFYFEIDYETEFQRKGPSKENRKEPLVSLGLLLDANYLPIDMCIYPGNESEKPHFTNVINDMKMKNKIQNKTIYIADKGLNCGNNVYQALKNGDGYIYSQSVKGASDKVKNFITNDNGFKPSFDDYGDIIYAIKEFIVDDAEITFTEDNGSKVTHKCKQKQVVTWSKSYAEKTRMEREKLIKKARSLISSPKAYDRSRIGDASSYINKIVFDKNGVIIEEQSTLSLDVQKIKQEERLDGFYMIVTSELNMSGEDIVKAYKNLSNIENSFRVQKLYLKLRPVFLSREERIKAHILISYLSLLMLRILERKILKDQFSLEEIIDSLREYECASIYQNVYFFFKYNDVIEALGKLTSSNVKLETQSLSGIKKLFKQY
jgi:transposase